AGISNEMPGPPQAVAAIEAATRGGARAVGRAHELGAIEPGYKADLTIVSLADPSFVPLNSAARQLVHAEAGRAVESVIVDGRGAVLLADQAADRAARDHACAIGLDVDQRSSGEVLEPLLLEIEHVLVLLERMLERAEQRLGGLGLVLAMAVGGRPDEPARVL